MSSLLLLARLLEYPQEDGLLANLEEARENVQQANFTQQSISALLEFLNHIAHMDVLVLQETYVEIVDRNRRGSLHLFEHVHGESRERGAAMIDLLEFYRERGMELSARELPDYLPAVLEFAASAPAQEGMRFLGEMRYLVEQIYAEHSRRGSLWSPVLAAVVEQCGGSVVNISSRTTPEPEPDIDALWEEPAVEFAGDCKITQGTEQ
jgi:nitrate reductase delta subunit